MLKTLYLLAFKRNTADITPINHCAYAEKACLIAKMIEEVGHLFREARRRWVLIGVNYGLQNDGLGSTK